MTSRALRVALAVLVLAIVAHGTVTAALGNTDAQRITRCVLSNDVGAMWKPDFDNAKRVMQSVCGLAFYVEAVDLRRALKTTRYLMVPIIAEHVANSFNTVSTPLPAGCKEGLLNALLDGGGAFEPDLYGVAE